MATRPEKTGEMQASRRPGQFAPGVSGNPGGRPRGSRNKTTQLCADLLSGDAEAIVAKLIERAKKGDAVALKLCVDRLVPVRAARDRTVDVELPDIANVADLVAAAAAVVEHAAAGRITLSEAKEFMQLLEGQRRLVETADLAVRIEALEVQHRTEAVQQEVERLEPSLRARVRVLDRREEVLR